MRSALAFCAGPAALSGYVPLARPARREVAPSIAAMASARRELAAGNAAGALRGFEAALAAEPRLALAHLGRAICLAEMGRDEEAQDALDATLDVARGQEEVLYQLARMCALAGNASLGIPLLTEAVRSVPSLVTKAAAEPLFKDHPAFLAAAGRL